MTFMKTISKEKEVNAKEEERQQAEKLNREFYVVDPKTGILDVKSKDPAEDSNANDNQPDGELMLDVISFLAEKTAERFDNMADGTWIGTVKEIVRRLEHTDPETAVIMIQSMFMATGYASAAVDLDILNICSEYDGDSYEMFIDELFETEVFNHLLVSNWLDEAFGNMDDSACLS